MTTTTTIAPPNLRPFPFVNDWRRGCWVARPTGEPDPAFVFAREFCTGTPRKATGMVYYRLEDLGGPGWIVAKDAARVRLLVRVTELGWEVVARDLPARDILAVVQAGDWDGTRCDTCHTAPVFASTVPTCPECERDQDRAAKAAAHLDTITEDAVPF